MDRIIRKNDNTIIKEANGVTFLQFKNLLVDGVTHGFSTRLGGVSTEHLSSMNLSFSRGDDPDNVIENHRRFSEAVGYDYKRTVFSDQVHKTEIKCCTEEDAGKGIVKASDIKEIDGLITNVPGLPLMTFYADCVPNLFYDPVKKVIGNAHSGWRGTVMHIGTKMVQKMQDEYGSNPADIIAVICPSICSECYEVSKDVIDEFDKEFTKEECSKLYISKPNGKYMLNLWMACKYNLLNAGIKEENILDSGICTLENSDILFSHRKTNGKRGNLAAVIMLDR